MASIVRKLIKKTYKCSRCKREYGDKLDFDRHACIYTG